jgi:hypothetical protein
MWRSKRAFARGEQRFDDATDRRGMEALRELVAMARERGYAIGIGTRRGPSRSCATSEFLLTTEVELVSLCDLMESGDNGKIFVRLGVNTTTSRRCAMRKAVEPTRWPRGRGRDGRRPDHGPPARRSPPFRTATSALSRGCRPHSTSNGATPECRRSHWRSGLMRCLVPERREEITTEGG